MPRRKTHEEFVKEVYDLVGDEYTVIDGYNGSDKKIRMRHNKCGHVYYVSPHCFLSGNRCNNPDCNIRRKSSTTFLQEVFALVGDEYTIIDKYIDNKTKIHIVHNKCQSIFYMSPTMFLSGSRCPKCVSNHCKTTDEFKSEVYNLYHNEYKVVGEYINSKTKIPLLHKKCGHIYYTLPHDFLMRKAKCNFCAKNQKKSPDEFKKEVFDLVGNEYDVLSDYQNCNDKVKFRHNLCHKTFYMSPYLFIWGQRCSHCRRSKGEKKIADFFDKNNIKYIPQYRFNDCRYKNPLPFDFAVFNSNDSLQLLIEYDGDQHFKPWKFKDKTDEITRFKEQIIRDSIKTKYCKDNYIKLWRIPYTKFDHLEQVLANNNLIKQLEE